MGRKSAFSPALNKIEELFNNLEDRSFSKKTLDRLFDSWRRELDIPRSSEVKHFIKFLVNSGLLHTRTYARENSITQKIVYTWKTEDDFTSYSGLVKSGYYTHYTAMYLHQLTLQIPKTHYLNCEHRSEMEHGELEQRLIDAAFSKPQRKSSKHYLTGGVKIVILNGKFTDRMGVIQVKNETQTFFYTDLERTLIDIAIRPVYSGGIFEVLEAYKTARDSADIEKLARYLKAMDYIYPYHQVIGFYLENAGYSNPVVDLFRKKIKFDFYLTYNIKNPDYSEKWKLYYPKGFSPQPNA